MALLEQYNKITKWPLGNWMFNKAVGFNAPFFSKIHPNISHYSQGHCEIKLRDRWSVRNHIGTINAGALCTIAELTGGLAIDSVVAKHLRWLPSGMTVSYIKKATGPQTCVCEIDYPIVETGEKIIPLVIIDSAGDTVFSAEITFYISHKSPKKN